MKSGTGTTPVVGWMLHETSVDWCAVVIDGKDLVPYSAPEPPPESKKFNELPDVVTEHGVVTAENGGKLFYAVQLLPGHIPGRIKFGCSVDPNIRVRKFRTNSPGATLIGCWHCDPTDEHDTIKYVSQTIPCIKRSREVFDFDPVDLHKVLTTLTDHFGEQNRIGGFQ